MRCQVSSPYSATVSGSVCRSHHAKVRQWLEDLAAAGDGAWAVVREKSSEVNVVGDVIDPVPVNRITDGVMENEIVGMYTNRHDLTQVVIQLGDSIHESLTQSGQSVLHLQMDEVQTKRDVGMI